MSHTPTDTRLAELAANVRQLVEPIHIAIQGTIRTHPPLLNQLRAAIVPARAEETGLRRVPDSRPTINVAAADALAEIEVGIAGWHHRLRIITPRDNTDWVKAGLRALVGAYPQLDDGMQHWLDADVDGWWELAARTVGWRPSELRRIR